MVALEGFEPSLKVPETCVLPLHHKAIYFFCLKVCFPFDDAKLQRISESAKFFGKKLQYFSKILLFSLLYPPGKQKPKLLLSREKTIYPLT